MAIVIKEIILSDTIEKFMEKVNFNFDQLMLAGGGPQGPAGPIGPIGPIGPKGDQGIKWYVGCTGTTAAIGATLYEGDLFLQKGSCSPTAAYPLGQVLEFDQASQLFVDTGVNLRGPSGSAGATGSNTGWAIYPGETSLGAYKSSSTESTPGPTSSFVFLKGDVFGETGMAEHPFYSRDTLYLGGFLTAANMAAVYPANKLPKLFVSPKTLMDSSEFFSSGSTFSGIAGSGIALVREGSHPGGLPLNQYSQSNIFIDDELNLNLTNFSDWTKANNLDGSITNDINLMSKRGINLLGGGYRQADSSSFVEISSDLQNASYIDSLGTFDPSAGGFLLAQNNTNGFGQIELNGSTSQLRIIAKRANQSQPDIALWNTGTVWDGSTFKIGIGVGASFKDANIQVNDMPYIGAGYHPTYGQHYIGFGTKPTTSSSKPSATLMDYKLILAANPQTITIAELVPLGSGGLYISGKMRYKENGASISAGDVLVSADSDGLVTWASSTTIGGWKNDTSCTKKIEITQKATRFASFQNSNGYTRVDIPSIGAHNIDMYFGNYSEDDYEVNQGHFISKTYAGGGSLSIRTGILEPCPTTISSRDLVSGSVQRPRFSVGNYGEIVIGSANPMNDPNSITPISKGLSLDSLKIYSSISEAGWDNMNPNIHLITTSTSNNPYTNGLIKFSPYQTGGNEEGYNSTTSIEMLRTWSGTNAGPGNIRFLGVGKSTKSATISADYGLPTINSTTGRGSTGDVGAHVMMIPDAEFPNKYGEDGKTYDYYELIDKDIHVSRLLLSYNVDGVANTTDFNTDYFNKTVNLYKWGTASSGWTAGSSYWGYNKFYGSRGTSFNGSGNMPNGFHLDYDTTDTINSQAVNGQYLGASADDRESIIAWNSPSSGVRFTPMNFSNPSSTSVGQKGLAWIDFNIDMGLMIEIDGDGSTQTTSNQTYNGIVAGPGQANSDWSTSSAYRTLGSPTLKYLRIKLAEADSSKLGLTSFIDNNDYTNRKDILTGATATQLKDMNFLDVSAYPAYNEYNLRNLYHTDWYPGWCKPMEGNLYLDQDFGFAAPWTDGYRRWSVWDDSATQSIRPWQNTITPIWGGGYGDLSSWGSNAFDKYRWSGLNKTDYSGRYQTSPFMWRVIAEYDTANVGGANPPINSYIEVAFPPTWTGINTADTDIWRTGDPGLSSIHDTRTEQNGGIKPIIPIMVNQFIHRPNLISGSKQRFNLDYAMNFLDRTAAFYGSHGFSLSGQGMVKWNRAGSSWYDPNP